MIFIFFLTSFIFTFITIPFLRKISLAKGWIDSPGIDAWKIHKKEIPILGGIAIFFSFTLALTATGFLSYKNSLPQIVTLLFNCFLMLLLGVYDDLVWKRREAVPFTKIGLQIAFAFLASIVFLSQGLGPLFLASQIVLVMTLMFYIVGGMNAMNMMDGMDGMVAGISIISLLGFIILSFVSGNNLAFITSLVLVGAISGFLLYNWHPASIFLGDGGSHFIGFAIAILTVIFTDSPFVSLPRFIAPVLIFGLPIINICFIILNRTIRRETLFLGHRDQLYHQFYKRGVPIRKIVLLFYFIQVLLVGLGITIYAYL